MKCANCGAELSDDAKFCSFCGSKLDAATPPPVVEENPQIDKATNFPDIIEDEPAGSNTGDTKNHTEPKSLTDKVKANGIAFWNKRSAFGKVATVATAVFVILALIAFASGRTAAAIISVLQIVLAVVSVLMHKGVIKLEAQKSWAKYLALVVAVLLTVLNIMSYSWGQGDNDEYQHSEVETYDVSTEPVITTAMTPIAASECIGADSSSIQNKFSSAGFNNIKTEKVEDLKSTEADKLNTVESILINGTAEFAQGQEFEKTDEIIIRYHAYEKCTVTLHVDFVANLLFSTYDVNFLWNGSEEGTLEHGESQDFSLTVDPGEYTILFENAKDSSVEGEITLNVDCDMDASYKISCYSDKVDIETLYVDRLVELAEGEVKMDVAASEYMHKNYEDVTSALKTIGFTNIEYNILYDIVIGWTDEGEVESVSIDGRTDFTRGEVFKQDAPVVITYHMKEEDDPNKPVETAPTETKTATPTAKPVETETPIQTEAPIVSNKPESEYERAYIRELNDYDLYYMFDMDTNTVVYFSTLDTYVERGTYTGNFSTGVTITWSHGEWTETFTHNGGNYATLIDGNGFEWEYEVCDVGKAQRILNGIE